MNPFQREYYGQITTICGYEDRIRLVRQMDIDQVRQVLAMEDLEKTVRQAAEIRLRKLERGAT